MSKAREQRNKKAYELYKFGKTQAEIAQILDISQPTVSNAIKNYKKHLNSSIDILKNVIDRLVKIWGFNSDELNEYYFYVKRKDLISDPMDFEQSITDWMNSPVIYYQDFVATKNN